MKKILPILLLTLAGAVSASAQIVTTQSTLNGGTNNIAATSANVLLAGQYPIRGGNTGVQLSGKLTGAGTSAVTIALDTSVDGANWNLLTHTLVLTAAGTTAVTKVSNVDFGGIAYLRVNYVTNANATAVTNLNFKFTNKPGR
jgi:hypothetical protein